jgi:endo-1,3-1,4-beta-glycanase ExoK
MKYIWQALLASSLTAAWVAPAYGVTSAELIRNQAYVYGRFEARIRFAPGNGVVSSFFLWKSGSEASGAYWNELDFEKLGADCHVQTNALYGAPVVDHSRAESIDADLCGDYHTYAFEWTPAAIVWLVDGVEVRREAGETATSFAENASAGMQIHFNVWPGDASFGGDFDPSQLPVQQYISWVQYSSYSDGAFTQQWREEFDVTKLPSGWSTGNWASPKGYSTHSASNVTFASGVSVLSLTADDAKGFTGTPPVDAAAGGTSNTGGATGAGGSANSETGGGGASTTSLATSTGSAVSNGDDGCGCRTASATHSGNYKILILLGLASLLARRAVRVPRRCTE